MWTGIGIAAAAAAAVAGAVGWFLARYPAFGARASGPRLERMRQSPQRRDGVFANELPTPVGMGLIGSLRIIGEIIKGNPNGRPAAPPEIEPYRHRGPLAQGARVTWFGHSALLLEIEGKTLFIDPMLGRAPSPVPAFGGKRYSRQPVTVDELPPIDAVVLSHDHYDHLDYGTIRRLKEKTRRFIVPLGVGAHLERWGVAPSSIEECDWGDETTLDGLTLACTPARHFSGRFLNDRNATLWCSWAMIGRHTRVFYSGDSGYGPHFRRIGETYGPFDLAMMECGQYDPRWSGIHMLPEETVQAHLDVGGKLLLPVHWGAFTLALHDWTDPAERAVRAARERGTAIATPRIGEPVTVGGEAALPSAAWWRLTTGTKPVTAAPTQGG